MLEISLQANVYMIHENQVFATNVVVIDTTQEGEPMFG
jgi:hypothetical protein